MEKVIWKVNCLVYQGDKLIGYDMVSITGEKRTVTSQELYSALSISIIANATIKGKKIVVQEPVQKRLAEQVVNIQLKASEFNLLYSYVSDLYDSYPKNEDDNSEILSNILQNFVNLKHCLNT